MMDEKETKVLHRKRLFLCLKHFASEISVNHFQKTLASLGPLPHYPSRPAIPPTSMFAVLLTLKRLTIKYLANTKHL